MIKFSNLYTDTENTGVFTQMFLGTEMKELWISQVTSSKPLNFVSTSYFIEKDDYLKVFGKALNKPVILEKKRKSSNKNFPQRFGVCS